MRIPPAILASLATVSLVASYADAQPSSVSQLRPKVADPPAASSALRALTQVERLDRIKLTYKGAKESDLQSPFVLSPASPTKVGPGSFWATLGYKNPKEIWAIFGQPGTTNAAFAPASTGSQLSIVLTGAASTGYLIDVIATTENNALTFETSFENNPQSQPAQTVPFQSTNHAAYVVLKQPQAGKLTVVVKNGVDWRTSRIEITPFN